MEFELYNGLPLRTIMVEVNEYETYYGVTTDQVNDLIVDSLQCVDRLGGEVEAFDQSYSYAVPQHIFEADENTIINYINENIDKIL